MTTEKEGIMAIIVSSLALLQAEGLVGARCHQQCSSSAEWWVRICSLSNYVLRCEFMIDKLLDMHSMF